MAGTPSETAAEIMLLGVKIDVLFEMLAVTIAEAKELDPNLVYQEWLALLEARVEERFGPSTQTLE